MIAGETLLPYAWSGREHLMAALLFDRQRPNKSRNPLLATSRSRDEFGPDTRFPHSARLSAHGGAAAPFVPKQSYRLGG